MSGCFRRLSLFPIKKKLNNGSQCPFLVKKKEFSTLGQLNADSAISIHVSHENIYTIALSPVKLKQEANCQRYTVYRIS